MSLPKFWNNVRTRTNLARRGSLIDFPKFDPALIERLLRKSPGWFAPVAVAGFDEADFPFLPADDRARLSGLVKEFSAIVAELPPTAPATDDRLERALPVFRDIVGLLEFDRYGDAEAFRIGKRIETAIAREYPKELAEVRYYTGNDNTGDPGIWIWAVLTDDAARDENFSNSVRNVSTILEDVSNDIDSERWPYVRFRTVSEQAELRKAGVR